MIKGEKGKSRKSGSLVLMKGLLLIGAFSLPLIYGPAGAAPKEVTLSPHNARLTEVTKVRLLPEGKELSKAVITIPGAADPASLIIHSLPDAKLIIEDHKWRQLPRDEAVRLKEIRRQVKQLQEERNGLQASIHGLDNQILFWQQQTKAKTKTLVEAGLVATAISRNIKKAFHDKLNLGQEIPIIDKKIKELDGELNQAGSKDDYPWEVTILISGKAVHEISITYSYTLAGCGWLPFYRVEARPERGEIHFAWKAEVWQNSGLNWNDITINLTTFDATAPSITPPAISPWIIKAREETKAKLKRTAADKTQAFPAAHDEGSPVKFTGESQVWPGGRLTIPSGSRTNLQLGMEIWPAEFNYVARPSQNPQATISATLHFPEAKSIPPGQAIFFYNGDMIGKSNFLLSGRQKTLFFGYDPQVQVTRYFLPNPSRDQQKSLWQWRLEAQNNHTSPIKLRIEEPAPRAADKRIIITLPQTPARFEEKSSLLSWESDLAAGEKKIWVYDIGIETPAGLYIDKDFSTGLEWEGRQNATVD